MSVFHLNNETVVCPLASLHRFYLVALKILKMTFISTKQEPGQEELGTSETMMEYSAQVENPPALKFAG